MYSFLQIHSAFNGDRNYIFLVIIKKHLVLTDKDIFQIIDKKFPELFVNEEGVFYHKKEILKDEYQKSSYDKYSSAEISAILT